MSALRDACEARPVSLLSHFEGKKGTRVCFTEEGKFGKSSAIGHFWKISDSSMRVQCGKYCIAAVGLYKFQEFQEDLEVHIADGHALNVVSNTELWEARSVKELRFYVSTVANQCNRKQIADADVPAFVENLSLFWAEIVDLLQSKDVDEDKGLCLRVMGPYRHAEYDSDLLSRTMAWMQKLKKSE